MLNTVYIIKCLFIAIKLQLVGINEYQGHNTSMHLVSSRYSGSVFDILSTLNHKIHNGEVINKRDSRT